MDIGDIIFDDSPTLAAAFNRAYRRMPPKSYRAGGRRSGKSSVRKTTPFKKYSGRRLVNNAKTKSLVKLVKKVTLNQAETHYKTTKFAMAPVPSGQNYFSGSVYHNSISELVLWDPGAATFPSQGNTDGERTGDEIMLTGIKVRIVMQIPWDRRNSKFKFYYVAHNSVQGNPALKSDLFHGTINNVMVDAMQTDRFKVKKIGSARLYAQDMSATSQDKTIIKTFWIPIKKKVTFVNDGSKDIAQGLKETGKILILGYDSITTSQTDLICSYMEAAMTVYYKDP